MEDNRTTKCKCSDLSPRYSRDDSEMVNTIADGSYTSLLFGVNRKTKEWFLEAIGDDYASTNVKYCPFCGRKLPIIE